MNSLVLQGVTLHPKFIFGINGQLNNGLFLIEDKKLLYVVGQQLVLYNIEEGG